MAVPSHCRPTYSAFALSSTTASPTDFSSTTARPTDFDGMTVVELKAQLKERGLKVSGLKRELIEVRRRYVEASSYDE